MSHPAADLSERPASPPGARHQDRRALVAVAAASLSGGPGANPPPGCRPQSPLAQLWPALSLSRSLHISSDVLGCWVTVASESALGSLCLYVLTVFPYKTVRIMLVLKVKRLVHGAALKWSCSSSPPLRAGGWALGAGSGGGLALPTSLSALRPAPSPAEPKMCGPPRHPQPGTPRLLARSPGATQPRPM